MSSSGLIYAVIVGAWAAYLVPMWLRRQDELNEARPTERFSTAIRLLSGKAAMERRYAKATERRAAEVPDAGAARGDRPAPGGDPDPGSGDRRESAPDDRRDAVDVRAFAEPRTMAGADYDPTVLPTEILPYGFRSLTDDALGAAPCEGAPKGADDDHGRPSAARADTGAGTGAGTGGASGKAGGKLGKGGPSAKGATSGAAGRNTKRAKVLARRRRTTMVLFLAFTAGTVMAAVGGLAFLWAPVIPGALLSAYIVHLRVQERRRFAATMDRRRAEAAAQRLRERRGRSHQPSEDEDDDADPGPATVPAEHPSHEQARPSRTAPPPEEPAAASRRALVEQTDHAEWVDQERRGARESVGWEPVPVPLPTYVSAPVAPRTARGVDLDAPDAWSSARSSTAADQPPVAAPAVAEPPAGARRTRDHGRTPLFDQYEDDGRPRAANE